MNNIIGVFICKFIQICFQFAEAYHYQAKELLMSERRIQLPVFLLWSQFLAIYQAIYEADRSTLDGSLPENAPPP